MAHGRTSQQRGRALGRRLTELSRFTLALTAVVLAGAEWGTRLAGDTVIPGGPLDELAHLLTTLLFFWALGPRARERFLVPALIASVAIDLDHIPGRLGVQLLTAGTPRPYTHSLLMIAIVLASVLMLRRRRDLLLGIAIGLAIHLWRDMGEGESGVSLVWPISDHSFQYPHGAYVAVIAVLVLIDAARCMEAKRAVDRMIVQPSGAVHSAGFVRSPEG